MAHAPSAVGASTSSRDKPMRRAAPLACDALSRRRAARDLSVDHPYFTSRGGVAVPGVPTRPAKAESATAKATAY